MGSQTVKPLKNPKKSNKQKPLRPKAARIKKKSDKKSSSNGDSQNLRADKKRRNDENKSYVKENKIALASASQQLGYFLNQFQSSNGVQLSSLEMESINESCIVELSQNIGQDAESLGKHMKSAFGPSWKETLCERQLLEGKIDPGSPAVLLISTSAIRSIELLRGVRALTKDCHAAKLFSKHIKVEEQASVLKKRVNIAGGTPSRIKKLIDMEALGLSRLSVIVLDMHTDVKGYSLLTLPQVREEFWDLYRNYFHQRMLQGNLRICLYGPIPVGSEGKLTEAGDN